MDPFAVHPDHNPVITTKADFSITRGLALQDTVSISYRIFMLANGVVQIDDVTFALIQFPGQICSVICDNSIAFFGLDICFPTNVGKEIGLQVIWKKGAQYQPFPDIFRVN